MAESEFANLTRAERALLQFADIKNHARGDFAFAGTSTVPNDPSNDPTNANNWDGQRNVRAELVRWMCVDPEVPTLVDPRGIRLLGARITGKLDLSHVHVPFGIALIRCTIPERMNFDSAEIPRLDLHASYIGEIFAPSLVVNGDADIGWDGSEYSNDLHASGETYFLSARIGGTLSLGGSKFHYSLAPGRDPASSKLAMDLSLGGREALKPAVDLTNVQVKGDLVLCCGFESQGGVLIGAVAIGGSLLCPGGHFINAGSVALEADGARIERDVYLNKAELSPQTGGSGNFGRIWHPRPFEADGLVSFVTAVVGGNFVVYVAEFKGLPSDNFGLDASGINVRGALAWQKVDLQGSGRLNLAGATIQALLDDEQSWPKPGNLILDAFTYTWLGAPNDSASRLRWLALQAAGFHPQPYRQLAKVFRETGDESGARQVLIAGEDARYQRLGLVGGIWGSLLKWTIGYGHRPLLTVMWAFGIILLGWAVVKAAARAELMRPTYPENTPSGGEHRYEELHPLLYSIDVFFPFVNLHQEHYWWPDSKLAGEWLVLGRGIRLSGSLVRYYLWFEIGAGWLLSAIFLAGVTGLLRNE